MKKLTLREKVLIAVMVCVAIAALVSTYYIIPQLEKIDNLAEAIDEEEFKAQNLRITIPNIDTLRSRITKLEEVIGTDTKVFYPLLANWEIDRMYTNSLQRHGLIPIGIAIGQSTGALADEPGQQSNHIIWTKTIRVDFSGTQEGFVRFCDEIEADPSARISNFGTDTMPESADGAKGVIGYADVELIMVGETDE